MSILDLTWDGSLRDDTNRLYKEAAEADRAFQQQSAREAMAFEADQAQFNRVFQQQSAREAMAFEADQAQLNRDFQADMANTAYQRAVADLKAAGLNPVLAAMNSGAATPAGAAASGVAVSGSSVSGRQASGSMSSVDNGDVSVRGVLGFFNTIVSGLSSMLSSGSRYRGSFPNSSKSRSKS